MIIEWVHSLYTEQVLSDHLSNTDSNDGFDQKLFTGHENKIDWWQSESKQMQM